MLHSRPSRQLAASIAIVVIYSFCIFAISQTEFGQSLEFKLATSTEFYSKLQLGETPQLSDKIKIFAFSDKDLAVLKRPNLQVEEWASMLSKIDKKHPKVIFIDKIFSFLANDKSESLRAIKTIEKIKTPIIVGAFLSKNRISHREEVSIAGPDQVVPRGDLNARNKVLNPSENIHRFPSGFLYGPNRVFERAFPNIGTLNYNGHLTFSPFTYFREQILVSHAAILTNNSISQRNGQIYINQAVIPIDHDGHTLINILEPGLFYKNISHFTDALSNPKKVGRGDTVVLLPEMYTGGTDFHQSPYGYVPGGLFITSIINSILESNWLYSVGYRFIFIFVSTGIGIVIAFYLSSFLYWIASTLFALTIITIGQLSFVYFNLVTPWFWPFVGFVSISTVAFAYKSFYWEKMARMLTLVETQRKELAEKAEKLVIKSKDLSTLMLNIKEGIFMITRDQEIHNEYSKYMEQIFDIENLTKMNPINLLFSYTELDGTKIQNNTSALKEIIGSHHSIFIREEHALIKEVNRKKPDQAAKCLEINWQPILDSEGTVDKLLVIVKDMTYMKQTQKQLSEIVKWQALIDMANGIAHEVNNPLAIIDGLNAQIRHFAGLGPPDLERIRELSQRIDSAAVRIATIVKKMQSFTLKSSSQDLATYSVTELFKELKFFCGSRLVNSNIHLDLNIEDPNVRIDCTKSTFIESILALINNSIDALEGTKSKKIKIKVTTQINTIVIVISDNGSGIPDSMRSTLFNPFVTGKPIGSGAGLGLFTAKNILESFSGQIFLLEDSRYTSFEIRIPRSISAIAPNDEEKHQS